MTERMDGRALRLKTLATRSALPRHILSFTILPPLRPGPVKASAPLGRMVELNEGNESA